MWLASLSASLIASAFSVEMEDPFVALTFDDALARAAAEDRVVMVDFFTTWCGPCKKLDQVTWPDPQVRAWLEAKTVALKVDAEEQTGLAQRYAVRAYPTLLFVRADGAELGRIVGFRDPSAFLSKARDLLAGVRPSDRVRAELDAEGWEDPTRRGTLADRLAEEQRYDEALEHYLWCFDEGAQANPAYAGVRVSFLLGRIVRLGQSHPPALRALELRRDAARGALLAGRATRTLTSDFAAINRALKREVETLWVFDALEDVAQRPVEGVTFEPRRELFRHVFASLVGARRYDDVLAFREAVLPLVQLRLDMFLEEEQQRWAEMDPSVVIYMADAAMEAGGLYYEALLGAGGHDEEADALARRLFTFAEEAKVQPQALARLSRHARRAGRPAFGEGAPRLPPQME